MTIDVEYLKFWARFLSIVWIIGFYCLGWAITISDIKNDNLSLLSYLWCWVHFIAIVAGMLIFCVWGWM